RGLPPGGPPAALSRGFRPQEGAHPPRIERVGMPRIDSPARAIARNVLVVAGAVLVLYVIYLLRRPISWLIIAAFIAVALAGPVTFFQRYRKGGRRLALVSFGLLAIRSGLGAVLTPPVVRQVSDVATNAPHYVHDIENYVHKNKTLN